MSAIPHHIEKGAGEIVLFLHGVGGGAVRSGTLAVAAHPSDLGFEQHDPFRQLVLRIGRQILAGEEGGGIASALGPVVVVHRASFSQARSVAVKRNAR